MPTEQAHPNPWPDVGIIRKCTASLVQEDHRRSSQRIWALGSEPHSLLRLAQNGTLAVSITLGTLREAMRGGG